MFNNKRISSNIMRISIVSALAGGVSIVSGLVYRRIFLLILTKEYLGIEGLFSNVIQVLSLAELGIGAIISYELYASIKSSDIEKIAALMNFYKKIYVVIALVVLVLGLAMLPFLGYLVKDAGEIPDDVNFYIVYFLFLVQSVTSYFFTYKQTLLAADQKGDMLTLFAAAASVLKIIVQITALEVTRNYQLMLGVSIVFGMMMNGFLSWYITRRYQEVFGRNIEMESSAKKAIFSDMKVMLCHRVGGTIINATDNIILSAFVGLGQLGIYSNYSLIINCVKNILNQLLGNFTASLGKACLSMNKEELCQFYEKLLCINFLVTNIATVCIYTLITPFVGIWQNKDMVFPMEVVVVVTLCFFLHTVRIINGSFTNASGLFRKDAVRPFIEASVNIGVSIYFTLKWGITGVFLGTVLSHLCTVWWREPYLLYKHVFQAGMGKYWFLYLRNAAFVVLECMAFRKGMQMPVENMVQWMLLAFVVCLAAAAMNLVLYGKSLVRFLEKKK